MNLSINGQSQVPPGFRFHPTEEELLHYYLRKKLASHKIDLDVICEVDLNKLEPWDIQEKCKIGSTPQNDWYFFSHKDKKYPTGTRTNRATAAGFWKATGRDKIIYSGVTRIGLRKTLVFYKGRAPHGQKSDWIMHEYRLDEGSNDHTSIVCNSSAGECCGEDGWVVCRVFKKKNYQKTVESPSTPKISSNVYVDSNLHNDHHQIVGSRNDGVLDQILMYMGRSSSTSSTCKLENDQSVMNFSDWFLKAKNNTNNSNLLLQDRFMHLPKLDSPSTTLNNNVTSSFNQDPIDFKTCYDQTTSFDEILIQQDHDLVVEENLEAPKPSRVSDWVTFDRLVASQLNGSSQQDTDTSKQLSFFGDPNNMSFGSSLQQDNDENLSYQYVRSISSSGGRSHNDNNNNNNNNNNQTSTVHEVYGGFDNDIWNFSTKPPQSAASVSTSDPLCHLSV